MKNLSGLSIKIKLFIPLIFIFLSFLLIGYFLIKNINTQSEIFIKENSQKANLYVLKGLDAWLKSEKELVISLSKNPDIINICKDPENDKLYKKLEKYFCSLHHTFNYYENIVLIIKLPKNKKIVKILDGKKYIIKDGTALIDSVTRKTVGKGGYHLKFIKKALIDGKFNISDPYPSILRGYPIFVVINPIKENKKILGAVLVAPKLWEFSKKFLISRIGKKGYTLIIDKNGKILAHKNFDFIFKKNIKDILPVNNSFINSSNKIEKLNINNKEIYVNIVTHKDTGWKVVSVIYKDDFIAPFLEKKKNVLFATIILTIFMLILLNSLLNKITIEPLERLTSLVKKYKPGKEVKKDEYLAKSSLEIEEIYRSFINLADTLNRNYSILKKSKNLLNDVINASIDPIFYKNNKFVYIGCNEAFAKMVGLNKKDILGKTDFDIFDKEIAKFFRKIDEEIFKTKKTLKIDRWFKIKDKNHFFQIILSPLKDKKDKIYGIVGFARELTKLKIAEEKIAHQALHDSLTDLPNRNLLYDRLEHAINEAKRENSEVAILFLDLDNFKLINDTLGHDIGDKLLIEVAKRLQNLIRKSDTIARIGGDEFIIILEKIESPYVAVKKAKEILQSLSKDIHIDSYHLHVTGSIGISIYPEDGKTTYELIKNADIAMYHAKDLGRNNVQLFSKSLSEKIGHEHVLENSLHKAITNKEFELHYQPQIEIDSGKIVGAEALIRWNHPKLGLLYPDKFIPLAENTGLIIPLGRWIIQEASSQAKIWNEMGFNIKISVNISIRQFQHDNIVDVLKKNIDTQKLDPKLLELEITENIAMFNIKKHINTMNELKELGFTISMDDFGIGYSSLSFLKKFPIDKVKIDKSFVIGSTYNKEDESIVKAIVAMCKGLNLKTVAEGVETKEHLNLLKSIGCDFYQGYYFSKPISSLEMTKMLKEYYENSGS
ncbi:bifunctional diguanylate cyclase/phosphodiesterase [Nitrosophilus kaiyonis]|uniref:bifunctional diguanylate cyclase/phosphodiesterase n=1 Tax=Nitrosophilus kaiyonis TaxID=2930200 RepID=UPI002493BAC2|nr:EAL domain-containing protein [Nitrosophilus kaiyonis]